MSWDADLIDNDVNQTTIKSWNYTHNCNNMISAVLEDAGHQLETSWLIGHLGKSWFKILNGKNGADPLLDIIINGLDADPRRFELMNPDNKWGSYQSLLTVLKDMRDTAKLNPYATWSISG